MSTKPKYPWYAWALGGVFLVAAILFVGKAIQGDGSDGAAAPRTLPQRAAPAADEPCAFDKADHPSYDDADLSGYATYLANDDPNNCRQAFVDRVRRFAADTCTHQPLVYPQDTEEFLGYLRSACVAAGTPARQP